MSGFLTIYTRRLSLRAFEARDAEPFADYRSDPDVARFQSWKTPYSIDSARRFIEEMRAMAPGVPGEWFQIALALKREDFLIGDCAFAVLADDSRQAEIGFIISRAYQRQGYGTEAVEATLA